MNKNLLYLILPIFILSLFFSCQNDDTDFFSKYTIVQTEEDDDSIMSTSSDTISVIWSDGVATVTGDSKVYVSVSGADVTIKNTNDSSFVLVLSGSSDDGSLLVYGEKKYRMVLNGLTLNNNDGPAINNQCGKTLYVVLAEGTTNTLTDGTAYGDAPLNESGVSIDQKGALFSEGQIIFEGSGMLTVNGNCKHAIASDDYIIINDNPSINVSSSASNGIKANDGLWINGGTLDINVTSPAGRGIKCDSVVVIAGGDITINTIGDYIYDTETADYSSAACIKCDRDFTMSGGSLTMTSSGAGGKGLNSDGAITVTGGTFSAITYGINENDVKPKAVKGTSITLSGGSFFAKVSYSWACDNGYKDELLDNDELAEKKVTVVGTPAATSISVDGGSYTSPYYSKKVTYIAF